MSRQHAKPVLIAADGSTRTVLEPARVEAELDIQALVHAHPEALPIAEIDPAFTPAVPICRELSTPAGYVDNFLLTPTGFPILVECKLWRNPQARREVVGQVLDYAKVLPRWTSADIRREVVRLGGRNPYETVAALHPGLDEAEFEDNLTRNLARGRCLLLIVGDGIREGTESIFEYLRNELVLQFSFGLIELPLFALPDGSRLALPRVLARTAVEVRRVVELPANLGIEAASDLADGDSELSPEQTALGDRREAFWTEFRAALQLDDPEQPIPRPPRQGWIYFPMPAPAGAVRLVVYRDANKGQAGLSLGARSEGQSVVDAVLEGWDELRDKLGGSAAVSEADGRRTISERRHFGDFDDPATRAAAVAWLAERTNVYVNVFRPAVRQAVADLEEVR